jgi:hypothetical protein
MSEIMQAVLRMPDNLFWADDPMSRHQHNQIRLEAADRIALLEAAIREHRNANWEGRKVVDRFDRELYAVLQEQGE